MIGKGSVIRILILSTILWQCTASQTARDETTEDMYQTEDDILRLLEEEEQRQAAQGDEPEPMRTEEMRDDVERLESELNQLKAELLMKSDRISELETQLQSRPQPQVVGMMTEGQFNERYRQAYLLYNSRKYREALNIWSELVTFGLQNSLTDNCQYWIGECTYALKNYRQAILEFEKVFTYPNSNKKNHAQYKIAKCYLSLGEMDQARLQFENFINQYPNSEAHLIADAKKHLGM